MTVTAFIVGTVILGVLILVSAFVVAGAVTGASKAGEGETALRQPEMSYFDEYEAADYIGVSAEEMAAMREQGLLSGIFVEITASEECGEEEYYDEDEDGNEIVRTRPAYDTVTRFIYSKKLLDEALLKLIKDGKELDLRSM